MQRSKVALTCTICFLCALLPLVIYHGKFSRLLWFGDDIALLAEYQQQGAWSWIFRNFAENFTPVFKALWLAAKSLVGGHYLGMIWILWLTHACIYALLAGLLLSAGLGVPAVVGVVGLASVSHAFLESLGWATQWSAVLSLLFFVGGLVSVEILKSDRLKGLALVLLFTCSLGTAFTFSRGVLSCIILLVYLWLNRKQIPPVSFVLAALPGLISIFMIVSGSGGNHQNLLSLGATEIEQVFMFFSYFLGANPFYRFIFSEGNPGIFAVFLMLAVKLVLWAFLLHIAYRSESPIWKLMFVLILFDLGNATLLAIGRYHTGFQFALSSRYQYESTFCLLPLLVFFLDRLKSWVKLTVFVSIAILFIYSLLAWRADLHKWVEWRGVEGRKFLRGEPEAQMWLGVPRSFMTNDAALRLFREQELK